MTSSSRSAFRREIDLILGALLCLLLFHSASAQPVPPPVPVTAGLAVDPAAVGNFTALRAQVARSDRKVRVIARLSQAAVGGGAATQPAKVVAETDDLRIARDRLATRMQGLGATVAPAIAGTALVVLEVNPAELDQLVATGEVSDVYEDVAVPPTLQDSGPLVHAPQARALGARGAGTTVAILDTGVQSNHPFLNGRVVEEACFSTTSTASNSTSVCAGGGPRLRRA